MSGLISAHSQANSFPVLPNPVAISSAIKVLGIHHIMHDRLLNIQDDKNAYLLHLEQ